MATVKRIIICCDGTWNNPDEDPTNVTKMVRSIKPTSSDGVHQVVFYDQGVGTGGKIDRMLGGAFGHGLEKNVLDCYRFLVHNFELGDELYCFGFSRGAYTARAFVGFIHTVGLLPKDCLDKLPKIYSYYRTPPEKRPEADFSQYYRPDIHMLGVFDTVGALGAPTPLLGKLTRKWVGFYNTHLCPEVKHAYHALALDERRAPFAPDLWTGELQPNQYLEQCWFVGAHSDIGGGYKRCGLSDIALEWMVSKARTLGLQFNQPFLDSLLQPDLHMQPHDSFTTGYQLLERTGLKAQVRRIYGEGEHKPINISIHDSVYQRMAAGKYQPLNPDFPPPDKWADRRSHVRHLLPITAARLSLPSGQANCHLLDFSEEGGTRILFDGPLSCGDNLNIDGDSFDATPACCVWKQGNQYGLRFGAVNGDSSNGNKGAGYQPAPG